MFKLSGLIFIIALSACTKKESAPATPQAAAEQLKARGQQIYMANCTSCHNPNPKLPGSVGPDLAGSSAELVKARVSSASYPPGYKPKRNTAVMPAFPALAPEADAIAAYLNSL